MEHSVIDFILNEDIDIPDKVYGELQSSKSIKKRDKYYNQLREMLTDEQKNLFDKYCELEVDEIRISNDTYFKEGVKIGVRIVAESMFD